VESEWRLGHRPGLDQLRGAAVAMVVVGHTLENTGVGWLAGTGVEVFFVLSGFLITRLLIEERRATGGTSFRRFYGRRARRLLPALPLAFLVCAMANATTGKPIALPALAAATYTLNYARVVTDVGAFGHFWSLAVEEHFYLVWPLIVSRASSTREIARVATVIAVAATVWRTFFSVGGITYSGTHVRISGILIGAALAVAAPRLRRPSRGLIGAAVAVIGVFSLTELQTTTCQWGFTAVALATCVLIASAVTSTRRRPKLEHLGRISYGVYLFSGPVGVIVGAHASGPAASIVAVVLGLAAAELSYRLIERRFLKAPLPHRQVAGLTPATPGSTGGGARR
jgi:peptidoglycan/LPS O-acetylase OafA/YrhL